MLRLKVLYINVYTYSCVLVGGFGGRQKKIRRSEKRKITINKITRSRNRLFFFFSRYSIHKIDRGSAKSFCCYTVDDDVFSAIDHFVRFVHQ